MTPFHFTLIFFIFRHFTTIDSSSSSTPFVAPIEADGSTNLYTVSIFIRTPLQSADLLLDLGGRFSWIDCAAGSYASTTHRYVRCRSDLCGSIGSVACSNCFRSSPGPGCHNDSCALFPENPVARSAVLAQALVDAAALITTDGRRLGQLGVVPDFVASCSDESLLKGLPEGVCGLAGLGRSNASLPAQVSIHPYPLIFRFLLPPQRHISFTNTIPSLPPYRSIWYRPWYRYTTMVLPAVPVWYRPLPTDR